MGTSLAEAQCDDAKLQDGLRLEKWAGIRRVVRARWKSEVSICMATLEGTETASLLVLHSGVHTKTATNSLCEESEGESVRVSLWSRGLKRVWMSDCLFREDTEVVSPKPHSKMFHPPTRSADGGHWNSHHTEDRRFFWFGLFFWHHTRSLNWTRYDLATNLR